MGDETSHDDPFPPIIRHNRLSFPMYQVLLTNRYLSSRVIPLLAIAAVALCVALVIVVVSVMSGFLDNIRNSGRTLMGDVVISYPVRGIPYYDELIKHIEAREEAEAATPVITTLGLLRMPYPDGDSKESEPVNIWGIDPAGFAAVTGFDETLQWKGIPDEARYWVLQDAIEVAAPTIADSLDTKQKIEFILRFAVEEDAEHTQEALVEWADDLSREQWISAIEHAGETPELLKEMLNDSQWALVESVDDRLGDDANVLRDSLSLYREGRPAIISGIHVSDGNIRTEEGTYRIHESGYWWMPRFEATLTTIPIDASGGLSEPESIIMPFANEFMSGLFPIDKQRVLIPIETAQELTHLNAAPGGVDPLNPERVIPADPAKASMVLVRASEGVDPEALLEAVEAAYGTFITAMDAQEPGHVGIPRKQRGSSFSIQTWEQYQSDFIGPVEKERELMRVLFSIIYLVCAALVLAILWSIVHEKTRDIGILRSIGASRTGIVGIFLLYGLVVGILGAILGLGLGWLITINVNGIHDMLGDPPLWLGIFLAIAGLAMLVWAIFRTWTGRMLPTVLGCLVSIPLLLLGGIIVWAATTGNGFVMWDPKVYYFTEIPNRVDMLSAVITMGGAVIFSLLGAFIPAAKAADTDPVNALRYE